MSLKGVFYIEEIWIHWPNIKSQKIILLVSWVYLVWSKKDQRFPPIFIKVLYLHLMVDWTVLFSSRITICPVGGGLPVIDRIRMECGASNQGNATLHNKEVWSQSAPPPPPPTPSGLKFEVEKLPLGWMDQTTGTHQHSQVDFLVGRAKETANNTG